MAKTRATDDNHAYIYTRESDHEHRHLIDGAQLHQFRRDNIYSAGHYLRTTLANHERPVTMAAEAERTERHLLPPPRPPNAASAWRSTVWSSKRPRGGPRGTRQS